jgi:N-acyl homoserine lactone hydrolase
MSSIDLVSTGSVRIRPQHRHSDGTPTAWWLLTSRRWTEPLPIHVGVIRHAGRVILFDTGQDRRSVTDPAYFPGGPAGLIYRRLARFDIGETDRLPARLAAIGVDIRDVDTVVLSHLHQDHIGGLRDLRHARIVVAEAEWAQLKPGAEAAGVLRRHIDLPGLHWQRIGFDGAAPSEVAPIERAHDLLDDGTLLAVPLPGHTPGSLGMLARLPGHPPVLFAGDLTYDAATLGDRVPGVGVRRTLEATSRMVRMLQERMPDLVVVGAHDPGAPESLRRARLRLASGGAR